MPVDIECTQLKFMENGRCKHTHACAQFSPASVGLARAHTEHLNILLHAVLISSKTEPGKQFSLSHRIQQYLTRDYCSLEDAGAFFHKTMVLLLLYPLQ